VDSLKHRIKRAVVEQVSSRPRQQGQFTFGTGYGRVLGIIESNLIPLTLVPSSKWKPEMGLRGQEKSASIALAKQMFPHIASQLARAKDDGRAEAILIAYYGSKECK
jgi:crossover junction endodeoxyribonuclease RuvC